MPRLGAGSAPGRRNAPGVVRRIWRRLKWPLVAGGALMLMLLLPVGYVEVVCRGDSTAAAPPYAPLLTDPASQRRQANTYLTYPEWHIVYAYDGLAEQLKTGDEHQFDYVSSVVGFWRSTCVLMRVADRHGGADGGTRTMIYTIGVSFTVEVALKAIYEESIGRTTAWWRGPRKSPQDAAIAKTAADYAAFLRQTPWYEYSFPRELRALWAPPAGVSLRAWERRIGIGTEFMVKAGYAGLIAAAAAADPAKLEIRSVVGRLDRAQLARIPPMSRSSVRAAAGSRSRRRATIAARACWRPSPARVARLSRSPGTTASWSRSRSGRGPASVSARAA